MRCPRCGKEMKYDINCSNGNCDYKHSFFAWMIYGKEGRILGMLLLAYIILGLAGAAIVIFKH